MNKARTSEVFRVRAGFPMSECRLVERYGSQKGIMAHMLSEIVETFTEGLSYVDKYGPAHKHFAPGIGPYGEQEAVRAALQYLRAEHPAIYKAATIKRTPDLLIPGEWALEFKIIRPFGDNGKPAEHWSENILHPYPDNTSSLGDCLKLIHSDLLERKAVIVLGYEHSPAKIDVSVAVCAFEHIARNILNIQLSDRCTAEMRNLRHPVHQTGWVFGWEVLGLSRPPK